MKVRERIETTARTIVKMGVTRDGGRIGIRRMWPRKYGSEEEGNDCARSSVSIHCRYDLRCNHLAEGVFVVFTPKASVKREDARVGFR